MKLSDVQCPAVIKISKVADGTKLGNLYLTPTIVPLPRYIILQGTRPLGTAYPGGAAISYMVPDHPEGDAPYNANWSDSMEVELLDMPKVLSDYKEKLRSNLWKNLSHSFLIGSDPEIFVNDANRNLLPAFRFLPSKEQPAPVQEGNPGCPTKTYWDGYQAEFTTQAGGCLEYHTDQVQYGLKAVLREARKIDPAATLSSATVVELSAQELSSAAEEHVAFGCMPSLNAYGLEGIKLSGREVPIRSAGGHIHFGCSPKSPETVTRIIKALDAILGVAATSMYEGFEDPRRRQMYGLPGEYRLPPHGIEYRTLSNVWCFHPSIMHMTFDIARKAFMVGERNFLGYWKADESETIDTLLSCNVEQARAILERNADMLEQIVAAAYPYNPRGSATRKFVLKAITKGVGSVIADPTNIEANWNLLDNRWTTRMPSKQIRNIASVWTTLGKKVA